MGEQIKADLIARNPIMPVKFLDENDENQQIQTVKINKPDFHKKEIPAYYTEQKTTQAESPKAGRRSASAIKAPLRPSNSIPKHELPAAGKATGVTNPSPKKTLLDFKPISTEPVAQKPVTSYTAPSPIKAQPPPLPKLTI